MNDFLTEGVVNAANRVGLKTESAMANAVMSDPLAAQIGASLGQKLVDGMATSITDLKACEADKACVAGLVTGVMSGGGTMSSGSTLSKPADNRSDVQILHDAKGPKSSNFGLPNLGGGPRP